MMLTILTLLPLLTFANGAATPRQPTGVATIGSLAISLGEVSHLAQSQVSRAKRHELVGEGSKISLRLDDGTHNPEQQQTLLTLDFAAQKEALLNSIFEAVDKLNYMGCFLRLVCDVASIKSSSTDDFTVQSSTSIVESVKAAQQLQLNEVARRVANDLMEAVRYGEEKGEVSKCESTYDQCQFTGQRMQEATQSIKTKMFGLLQAGMDYGGGQVNVDAENAPAKPTNNNDL